MRFPAALALLAIACGGPQIKEPVPADLSKHAPATLEATRPREGDPNVVKLRVYADPGVRALPRWKEEITEQIDYASQLLTPLLGARLSVEEVKDWARAGDPSTALKQLAELDKGEGVTWVVGYVAPGDTASKAFSELGMAEPLGKHVIVRAWAEAPETAALAGTLPDLKETERNDVMAAHRRHKQTVILLHFLATTLGGIAEADPAWILHPSYSPKQNGFADKTRELLTLALDARVTGGTDQEVAKLLLEVIDKGEWGGWIPTLKEQTTSILRAAADVGRSGKVATDIPTAALDAVGRVKQLARQEDLAGAIAELDNILTAYPATASLHQLKCDLMLAPRRIYTGPAPKPGAPRPFKLEHGVKDAKAIAACRRVSELAPGDPGPHLAMGEAWVAAKDLKAARDELMLVEPKIANLPDKLTTEATWRRLAAIYKAISHTWAEDALAKGKLVADPLALEIAQERARYGVPRGSKLVPPEQEVALVTAVRGVAPLIYSNKYGEAEKALSAAEKKWPGAPGIFAMRCDLQVRMGQMGSAKASCAKAIAVNPDQSWALYLMGVIALKTPAGTKEGVEYLKKAIAVDAGLGQAWRTLAKAYTTRLKDRAAYEALAKEYQAKFGQPLPP